MGYPLALALRYLGSKKRAFISVGTAFAMLGVTLGVAALAIVMSVTGGFQEQFREKVLGVNAHLLVLKYSIDFREYREIMKKIEPVKGIVGMAPFVINPMMLTHRDRTATGVLLKGVDPVLMPKVLDLPKHIIKGSLDGLRRAGAAPAPRTIDPFRIDPGSNLAASSPNTGPDKAADAGVSILDIIAKQIAEDEARADAGATNASKGSAIVSDESVDSAASLPSDREFVGSVTPDGGFASKLPDDDELPAAIDPDPCKNHDQIGSLAGIVIGRTLAQQLNAEIGDCVQVTSPTIGISIGASGNHSPIAKQFRVISIFEAGFDQYDSRLVYTDLFEAQAFYDQGDSVTGIEMNVDDIDKAQAIGKEIDKILANPIYHSMDWRELNHGLFTALFLQKVAMSSALGLIIIIAAFTVVAALVMLVLEKKQEVAVLKALGAKDDAILRVFIYQGGIIGLVGTSLGLILGYFGCRGVVAYEFPLDPKVYFISKLPVNMRPFEFGMIGIVAMIICLIATIPPALYAAWLRPSDGLRAE